MLEKIVSTYQVNVRKNIPLMMNGTVDIKSESMTAGSRPLIRPRITLGRSRIQRKKMSLLVKYLMLEIVPIATAGSDQKMTIAAMAA